MARALVYTLGEEIAKKVQTFHSTVGEVVLLNKVAPRKAVVRVSTLAYKLTKV